MITNRQLMSKKGFIKSATLISLPNIIALSAEEADVFIDYVIDQSFWKGNARIVKMAKPEKNIRTIGFTSNYRFLKPAATFASSDYLKTFSDDKITLASKKVRGAIVIYDDDLEDNIEGQEFADHLMKMVAKKVANELDEAYYVSGTTNTNFTSTDIRSLWNGFRYCLMNNTVLGDAATFLNANSGTDFANVGKIAVADSTTGIWEFKFAKMLAKLPSKYKVDGLAKLRFFCNDIVVNDYIEALSARATVLGDNAILGKGELSFGTVPIAQVPLMPATFVTGKTGLEDYEAGAAGNKYADVILTHSENFIIGIQRELKLETKRAPEDEANYVFYALRMDLSLENPSAAVVLHDLIHS